MPNITPAPLSKDALLDLLRTHDRDPDLMAVVVSFLNVLDGISAAAAASPLVFDPANKRVYLTDGTNIRVVLSYDPANVGPSIQLLDNTGFARVVMDWQDGNSFDLKMQTPVNYSDPTNLIPQSIFQVDGFAADGNMTLTALGLPTANPHIAGACWLNNKVLTVCDRGTQQVETATVVGTITLAGNATVIITMSGLSGSPVTYQVPVALNDTATQVAAKIVAFLQAVNAGHDWDAVLYPTTCYGIIGSSSPDIVLTKRAAAANDGTLNININNGTCTGLTAAPTSANTTAGAAPS